MEFKIGDRVRVREGEHFYRSGDYAVVAELPWRGGRVGYRYWVGVRFEDNPKYVAKWHKDYFEAAEKPLGSGQSVKEEDGK